VTLWEQEPSNLLLKGGKGDESSNMNNVTAEFSVDLTTNELSKNDIGNFELKNGTFQH
jgi:hypothetical protein